MRRAVLAGLLAVASLVVFLPQATANGTCTVSPNLLRSGSTLTFKGKMDCGATLHQYIYAEANLLRRSPGGTWNSVAFDSTSNFNVTQQTAKGTFGWRCEKDYKVVAGGVAKDYTGGGIHSGSSPSPIMTHTC